MISKRINIEIIHLGI